jgi:hypothetical protein
MEEQKVNEFTVAPQINPLVVYLYEWFMNLSKNQRTTAFGKNAMRKTKHLL